MADEENPPVSLSDSDSDDEFFDAVANEEKACEHLEKGTSSAEADSSDCPTELNHEHNPSAKVADTTSESTSDKKPEVHNSTNLTSPPSSKTEQNLLESCKRSTDRISNPLGDSFVSDTTVTEDKQAISPGACTEPTSGILESRDTHDVEDTGAKSKHFLDASESSNSQPVLTDDPECIVSGAGDAAEGLTAEEKETDEMPDGGENKMEEEVVVDEEEMRREREDAMTEEEREGLREESQTHKARGNSLFKQDEFLDAISAYTQALEICPLCYKKERSVMYGNRAVCRLRREQNERAIEDCNKALELQPNYLKVWLRRANTYELMEKLDEALADFKQVLELDPSCYEARAACMRLPGQINERNEKLKEEMFSKLKDLGNLVLRPFGLSTDNFQMQQDPNTGGYSVNFRQNPTSGNGRP